MTQKEKQLLLKDLCARLPYCIIIEGLSGLVKLSDYYSRIDITKARLYKPYLRPMSSMTEDEQKELEKIIDGIIGYNAKNYFHSEDEYNWDTLYNACDWLNAHHFDYRGLIEKGLAIEAPEDMY